MLWPAMTGHAATGLDWSCCGRPWASCDRPRRAWQVAGGSISAVGRIVTGAGGEMYPKKKLAKNARKVLLGSHPMAALEKNSEVVLSG
jgi:hypothetical protein